MLGMREFAVDVHGACLVYSCINFAVVYDVTLAAVVYHTVDTAHAFMKHLQLTCTTQMTQYMRS